jgi:dipeptidyl aminopeptidase/acylaminoacyl peptidase
MIRMSRFPALLLALCWAAPCLAQSSPAKRPMTFADMTAMHRVSDPQPSPDGQWVLFSVQDVDLAKNKKITHLWIVPADGKGESKPVTAGVAGESRGRFSPDGKQVLYSNAMDSELYLAPFDSSAGTLGTANKLTSLSTGADGGMWSPDGKRILFLSEVYPECAGDYPQADQCNKQRDDAQEASPVKAMLFTGLLYRHWNTYLNAKRSHLFVMNADGTAMRDLTPKSVVGDHEVPTFSLGGPDDYAWAPDSHEVAYVTDLDPVPAISTAKQIYAVRLDDPGAPIKKISQSKGGNYTPRYSPDGKWIAFRSQERAAYESDRFRLALYDRAKSAVSYPLPKFDGWIEEIEWSPLFNWLWFTTSKHGETGLYDFNPNRGHERHDPNLHEDQAGEFGDLAVVDSPLFATRMTVASPNEIVSVSSDFHREPGEHVLTHLNKTLLDPLDLPAMESFWFKGALNTPVQGFLIKPPNFDASKKYPVKFLIHGGPQGAWGDAWSYRWNAELFAADGYVVVMINPRGSTGYGQKFIDQINGDWGGKPFVDLMRGLDYAEAKYPFIDKTRECALGASYGGYMADWILGHTHRFACIVTHDGMFDPAGAYGATEELWFNEWEFKGKPWDYYGKPAALDPYRKWSPALAAKNFKTPTLVVHGQFDYRLDVSQGLELFTTLQREGVPSEMLYFPNEGHWVLKPRDSQLWYKTVNAWCDKWTHTNGAQ